MAFSEADPFSHHAVTVGTFQNSEKPAPTIQCEHPDLARHIAAPWTRAYLAKHYPEQFKEFCEADQQTAQAKTEECSISAEAFARHTLLCGASGSGKTRLMAHLLAKQLTWGDSMIALDPKRETLMRLLSAARDAGIPANRITLLLPLEDGRGCPGWNPIIASEGISLSSAVGSFVSLLKTFFASSWGPRLESILTNTALIVGSHGLSLLEVVRFLQNPEYRSALLAEPLPAIARGDALACNEAMLFFQHEFSVWSESEQRSNSAPVLNKLYDFLNIPFLRTLFCARENTLDLPSLWRRQQVILIQLDAMMIGDNGVRLLAGLILHHLFNTATRAPGKIPVALAIDELGISERFAGEALTRILAMAREYHLRLTVACQHMGQLSSPLQSALLTSTAVRFFFRLGIDDARNIASVLSVGRGKSAQQFVLDVAPSDTPKSSRGKNEPVEPFARETWYHEIFDGSGQPLKNLHLAERTLERQRSRIASAIGEDAADLPDAVRQLRMLAVASGVPRAYVKDPLTHKMIEVGNYVRGVRNDEVSFHPFFAQLSVSFPRPRVRRVERPSEGEGGQAWLRTLLEMPVRSAIIWQEGSAPRRFQVAEVPDALRDPTLDRFARQVLDNFPGNYEETDRWRTRQIEKLIYQYRLQKDEEKTAEAGVPIQPTVSGREARPPSTSEKPSDKPVARRNQPALATRKSSTKATPEIRNGAPATVGTNAPPLANDQTKPLPAIGEIGGDGSLA